MPSLSRSLEQALHRAIKLASDRHHEYATLEHLLLALMDDTDASAGDEGLQCRHGCAAQDGAEICRRRTRHPGDGGWRGRQAHHRLPARGAARRAACAEFRPRRGDRRQCAGRPVHRAREPRRLFPARAEHDAAGCGELYQPRHRQAPGHEPAQAGARRRRGRGGREADQAGHRGAGSLLRQPQRESQVRPGRSADRPRPPKSSAPSRSSAAARRTIRCSWAIPAWARPPSPKAWRARSSRTKCPEVLRGSVIYSLGHGLADRGHALSRRFRGTAEDRGQGTGEAERARSCSSTRSTP